MLLAGQAHPIVQLSQVMADALCARFGNGMVPRHAVAYGVEAGVEFGAKRRAHGHSAVSPVEPNSLARQPVDVRRLDVLAAETSEVVVRDVVGEDEEEVGPILSAFFGTPPPAPRAAVPIASSVNDAPAAFKKSRLSITTYLPSFSSFVTVYLPNPA